MSWDKLLSARATRRSLFRTAAIGGAASVLPLTLSAAPPASAPAKRRVPFTPIPPSQADEFLLAPGYDHEVVLRWGDDIGNGVFGFDPDFTAFLPIDLLERGYDLSRAPFGFAPSNASSRDGLLFVNHEDIDLRFVHGPSWRERSAAQVQHEQTLVGASFTRVRRSNGRWSVVKSDPLNRRLDARTEFRLTGPAARLNGGPRAIGTIANCSGGVTPWGTVLTCEENVHDYLDEGYQWDPAVYGEHHGWIVEIDPFDPQAIPRKHTAMGRFRHENVCLRVARDGTVVAYMGDDKKDSCVYKFIADRKLREARERTWNLSILESGQLYAADFGKGRWIPLPMTAEALVDARTTAIAAGATPVDRPEDLEVHPLDGSVFIAMTNNSLHGNFHGHIVRLSELDDDPAAKEFTWSVFATGGPQSGFSSPDNLLFDAAGNLWMACDVSNEIVGSGIYRFAGNNSLFFLPRDYEGGQVYRFASGPVECELTGPSWTPDGSTLFLSVQHPGANSKELETKGPSSHWPDGGNATPRGAVVAISGFVR